MPLLDAKRENSLINPLYSGSNAILVEHRFHVFSIVSLIKCPNLHHHSLVIVIGEKRPRKQLEHAFLHAAIASIDHNSVAQP